ncbi:MAG: hypothetical protein FWE23_07595 [Chitinivibrionia bacterium]|jgi:hypothetical protein|nr:hypothetical protein [Chitinivibrionia bacterium]
MKFAKLTVLFLLFVFACSAFAGSRRNQPEGTIADTTAECVFMREVCAYAWDLQREVEAMTENDEDERTQKREMMQVLNSSIMRCENARRECTRSVRR